MDLSINKTAKIKQQPSFQGLKGNVNSQNKFIMQFIVPPHDKDEDVTLQFVFLDKNQATDSFKNPKKENILSIPFANDTLELDQKLLKANSDAIAYRFVARNKKTGKSRIILDPFKTINIEGSKDEAMNIIDQGVRYGVTPKAGSMYHAFKDANKVELDGNGQIKPSKSAVANHVNQLGGTMEDLIWLLRNTDRFDAFRYVMTNPEIGNDGISSHKYWPSNQYQCPNIDNFLTFNRELFLKGKGYVADGAFTSQGLQSPIVQHVLKWGKDSELYTMLKINGDLNLGILPNFGTKEGQEANKHIGVRIVNNPNSEEYDNTKETYIQFFDERLVSEGLLNSNELIQAYDMQPEDHYDITTHQDSVLPYYFEIQPWENKIHEFFKDTNTVYLKDYLGTDEKKRKKLDRLLSFENFKVSDKQHASGATLWDGNVDIIKMNLSNPANFTEKRGTEYARNYLLGVASFWTETVQSDLLLNTAKLTDKEKKAVAKKNDVDFSKIDVNTLESVILEQNKEIKKYVDEFPIQSIETSPELSAVFTLPSFKKEYYDKGIRETLIRITDEIIESVIPQDIPQQDRKDYKTYLTKIYANTIIKKLIIGSMNSNCLNPNGSIDYKRLKEEVTLKSMLRGIDPKNSKDEMRLVISKMKEGFADDLRIKSSRAKIKEQIKEELKGVSLKDLKLAEAITLQGKGGLNWRFDAARDIGDLDAIRSGETSFDSVWNGSDKDEGVQKFWVDFVQRIREHHPSSYIINEITCLNELVTQKGGNNTTYNMDNVAHWFAYDEKLARGLIEKTAQSAFEKASTVSGQEKTEILTQIAVLKNPKSTVDELNIAVKLLKNKGVFVSTWEEHIPYAKEMQFLERSNSTTDSNYSALFNKLSEFAGTNPEKSKMDNTPGDVSQLKGKVETFMKFAQPNTALLSHVFVDNHDKPHLMHTLPIDMTLFLSDNAEAELNKPTSADLREITEGRKDYKNISTRALAVARAYKKAIEKSSLFNEQEKSELLKALKILANGKKRENSEPSLKRAESFGNLPYNITINDMFKLAGIKDKEKETKFHKEFLSNSMDLQERLWQVMGSLIGVNTLFNGTEFALSGYESSSKNKHVTNRNQIPHHLAKDPNFAPYYNKIMATSGLYKLNCLSAVKEGTPVSCDIINLTNREVVDNKLKATDGFNYGAYNYFRNQIKNYMTNSGKSLAEVFSELDAAKSDKTKLSQYLSDTLGISSDNGNHDLFASNDYYETLKNHALDTDDNVYAWPLYKYDEKGSKTISIITNNGMPKAKRSFENSNAVENIKVKSIPLNSSQGNVLPEDTVLYRKIYDENSGSYVTDKTEYKIQNGAIVSKNGNDIELNDTVETFYVPNEEERRRAAASYRQR